jgi:hypothetical protein
MKKAVFLLFSFLFFSTALAGAQVSDLEDLSLDSGTSWNGSDKLGGFESGGAHFNNFFDDTFGPYWEGFAYSNMTDTQTPDFSNQYSAITGKGVNGSSNYAVSYTQGFYGTVPRVTFPYPITVSGTYVTNTTYAYWSISDGDAFSKKFGGEDGNDPDWFKLTITGKDAGDKATGTVAFYLADYRFEDNSNDYIVDQWTWVDLSPLGEIAGLEFVLSSSDEGDWGMNTPAYFALDHLNTCSAADYDQDGIPDHQAVDPSVDLNEDNIADLSQSFIKSLKTIVGNAQMGISIEDSPTVAEIMMAEAVDPAVLANSAPMPAEMPYGLMSFTLKLKPGEEEAEVRVIFSEPVSGVKKWYKYNAKNNNGSWEDYSDLGFVSFGTTSSGNAVVVLRLKDGGYGDADGVLNGYIVDPGGLAILSEGTDTGSDQLSTSSPGGGAGGCFIGTALSSEMNIGTCFLFWARTVSACVASFWFSPRAASMASDGINEENC